ncbi:MAG: hypothetical protein JXA60_08435 [Candidatus Coatesbacteria bacterium]|nr:hypothetical protein [Candidatus Coatesbacteria bacterium]
MNKKMKKRQEIIDLIVDILEPLDYVKAMWEAGSTSFNRTDEWSDIDLMVIAEEKEIENVFRKVKKCLMKISPIDIIYDVPAARAEGFYQKFYRLADISKFMLIDLAIFPIDAKYKYLEREIHNEPRIYFDKGKFTFCKSINKKEFNKKLKEVKEKLKIRTEMFSIFFEKEMKRKNYIEAVDFYYNFALNSLIIALRIIHTPFHYNFRTKYIHYELPDDIIKKLSSLYFIKDEKDLKEKFEKARKWTNKLLE